MIYLLDSGPLGRLVERDRLLAGRLLALTAAGDHVDVPPTVRAEMYTGAGRNRTLITRLNQVLADLDGAPIVREDGALAGRLLGRLGPGKRTVSLVDALLAAAGERRGAVVLTGDPHDFQRLRDEAGCRVTFAVI